MDALRKASLALLLQLLITIPGGEGGECVECVDACQRHFSCETDRCTDTAALPAQVKSYLRSFFISSSSVAHASRRG